MEERYRWGQHNSRRARGSERGRERRRERGGERGRERRSELDQKEGQKVKKNQGDIEKKEIGRVQWSRIKYCFCFFPF